MPVHDKSRRDQIGAELRLLKHCQIDAAARDEKESDEGEPDGEPAVRTGTLLFCFPNFAVWECEIESRGLVVAPDPWMRKEMQCEKVVAWYSHLNLGCVNGCNVNFLAESVSKRQRRLAPRNPTSFLFSVSRSVRFMFSCARLSDSPCTSPPADRVVLVIFSSSSP